MCGDLCERLEMLTTDDVKKLIEESIPEARVEVTTLWGTPDHFSARVTSPAFEGKSLIEQHKMVNQAVGDHLTQEIHALQIKTIAARPEDGAES